MRRLVRFSVVILTASFMFTACDMGPSTLVSPDGPSAAKGGKPGKPGNSGGGSPASNLVEYYVIPSPDGVQPNLVHVVVDGSAARIGAELVHDYFFDGIRTDDYSPHYEYFFPAAFDHGSEQVTALPDGYTHIDAEWSGAWWTYTYDCAADGSCTPTGRDTIPFWDFMTTDVATAAGGSADPFALAPSVFDENLNRIAGWQPQGIILDGQVQAEKQLYLADGYHAGATVTSYMLHSGSPASIRVGLLSMNASDLSCSVRTERQGKGRNKTTTTYTTISASATAQFQADDGQAHDVWAEFHLRPLGGELTRYDGGNSVMGGNDGSGFDSPRAFTVSTQLNGEYGSVEVELVMDYLQYVDINGLSDPAGTYDPALNSNVGFTTQGGPSTTVDDGNWPEAIKYIGTVTCH